ncbi:MAG: hypothetical protein ACREST_08185 [Steroidobacteraceae bacterium]
MTKSPRNLLVSATLLALSACGDGGGALLTPGDDDDDGNPPPADCTGADCGEVRIALTDADGDFLSYTVDVVSIRLEDADGGDVEVLPDRQRVDFAELADVSEFAAAMSIPIGSYERAFVRLDFSEAEIVVEVDGVPTPGLVVDANADALDTVDLEIQLDAANPLVVAAATPALLQLDFDLEASHEVNLGTTPATLTAAPFLVAGIEPVDTREFRASGPLTSVDETASSYVVDLRPFHHPTDLNGEFSVATDAATVCEVNGNESTGADCLAALADLPTDTSTVAHGAYDVVARTFTADRVQAGTSVPGAAFDTAIGVVVARNLDVVTIRGGTLVRQDGEVVFAQGDIDVALGSGTDVTRDGGSPAGLDIDSISVGQRIEAYGDASISDFEPTLDAAGGRVRQLETQLTGFVLNTVTGEVTLELFSIDGRDPQFFDFDGTGSSSITEADPRNYQLDSGTLAIDEIDDSEGIAAAGFVAPFRSAPPDFEAATLTDFDALPALLGIGWGFNGTAAPFLSMGQNGFVIDVTNLDLGNRQFLEIGPRVFDINADLPEPITVEPPAGGPQLYAVALALDVEVFSDFGEFATRVNSLLNSGSNMRSFTARGAFDVDTTTLEANYVAISFVVP